MLLLAMLLVISISQVCAQYEKKSLQAVRIAEPPRIDGVLDEAFWKDVPSASHFVIDTPHPGRPLEQNTEVKIAYNHEALFIGFVCYDTAPDSVLRQLSGRDQTGNSDLCGITFSCYRDGINGFSFNVTPNAEQYDARIDNSGEDISWNAVWYCKTKLTDFGWVAEFKIPFAAIRFPNVKDQEWNINFVREVRRNRHHSYWNGVNPVVPGFLTQMGVLRGISDIKPPRRIFFYPYASSYYNTAKDATGKINGTFSYNAGMDMKLGLSDAFTMDATLIPDFGQTISDQQVLNLTAYELQFSDNRQFFTEGTELFTKGGIFYSRRIGFEKPFHYYDVAGKLKTNETIVDNPLKDHVVNAIKISGRDKNKLGIGFFNAVTSPTDALVRDKITGLERKISSSSLTNYNVLVLDQILPNNSYVSIINTSVLRGGEDFDVNVLGTAFEFRNKKNDYSISGSGARNSKYGPAFSGPNIKNDDGFRQNISLSKLSGNWRWSLNQASESDTYDPTDLGFNQVNNSFTYNLTSSYFVYKPFGRFNKTGHTVSLNYNNLYKPYTFTSFTVGLESNITTKKFNTYGLSFENAPVRGYDYFEPRVWGKVFRTYAYTYIGGWYSSDYRKKIAIDLGTWYSDYENPGRFKFNWRLAPRIRLNDHLFITYVYSYQSHKNDIGFAFQYEDTNKTQPVFGKRDVISHTNVLTLKYAFNRIMTLNLRVRHYWGFTKFSEFYSLNDNGYLGVTDVTAPNQSFNSFTIDMLYSWIFKPGSELSIVWKNAIINFDDQVPVNLTSDLDYTFSLAQTNSYSIKLIYFLDYHAVTDQIRRKPDEKF